MNRARALTSLKLGEVHNVYVAPSKPEWEAQTIAIKIPVGLGLVSYRLLAVHKDDLSKFSDIKSIKAFKKLKAAMRLGWITTAIFKQQEFNYVESQNFDGLFYLLESKRVDYIPRAIYEIYDELEVRENLIENLVVEPTLALYIPTSTYVYVSPKEPRLAQRIEKGINTMHESGELKQLVDHYYKNNIERANLKNRTILRIENPFYPEEDLLRDSTYWYKL